MMTCLQIHNDYLIPGGETKSALLIADLLEKRGIKVIRYYKSNENINLQGFTNKIKYGINSIYNKQTINDLQKIIDGENIDFALVHNTSPLISNSVYKVLHSNNIRIIKYLQNYNLICLNGALNQGDLCIRCQKNSLVGVKNRCYKSSKIYSLQKSISKHFLQKKYIKFIDDYIAISEYVKEKHVEANVEENKIHVIYHFCKEDTKVICANNSNYFLYMGRLSQEKGIMTLIKAVSKQPSVYLKIMGKGDLEHEIQEYLSKQNIRNIELIGYKTGEEKNEILGNALALVVPSEWEEPFGRIVIEAYRVGTPVIACRIGGLQELVKPSITGYLFDKGDENGLLEAIDKIRQLTKEEHKNLRNECICYADKFFSEDAYYLKFSKLLKGI